MFHLFYHLLIFLVFSILLWFCDLVCLRPVSCVPNVAIVSVLSILRFSLTFT